jgi:glucan biosynthesis protein
LAQPIEFAYTLSWSAQEPVPNELAHTAATRISQNPNTQLLNFDIDWQRNKRPAAVNGDVQANVQVNGGNLLGYHIQPNPQLKGWRLTIQVQPANGPIELKAALSQKGEPISESWRYTWLP